MPFVSLELRVFANPIFPAQEGFLVLRHAHNTNAHRWIRAQPGSTGVDFGLVVR